LPELPCESLRLRVGEVTALSRVADLATTLAQLGLEVCIAADVPLDLVPDAVSSAAAIDRFALAVASAATPEMLAKPMIEIARAGRGIELALDGTVAELPFQVERAAAALELAGERDVLLSLAARADGRATHAARIVAATLRERGADWPLMLRFAPRAAPRDTTLLDVSLPGSAFSGLGAALDVAYRILQGARRRTTRTEYISCPSCGRTLFDLEETTARIKQCTEHLGGVKIAVMGCIVNGPGEMADADFGYVGSGVGTVTLYAGKRVVARSIPEATAPDRLIEVIREAGMWRDP
jgi:(E)-4-hydroxy-3-methylbut-2-enyl-diphosphate synthase